MLKCKVLVTFSLWPHLGHDPCLCSLCYAVGSHLPLHCFGLGSGSTTSTKTMSKKSWLWPWVTLYYHNLKELNCIWNNRGFFWKFWIMCVSVYVCVSSVMFQNTAKNFTTENLKLYRVATQILCVNGGLFQDFSMTF